MPYRNNEIKSGMIVMWSGLVSDVPKGWSICDGTNGTPDLRQKFVRGASAEIGSQGGSNCHTHAICSSIYCITGPPVMVNIGSTVPVAPMSHTHSVSVLLGCTSNIPPFYELIFIRKD